MRFFIIVFFIVYVVLDIYVFRVMRNIGRVNWQYWYLAVSLLVLGNLVYQMFFNATEGRVLNHVQSYAWGFFLALIVFKIVFFVLFLSDYGVRLGVGVVQKVAGSSEQFSVPSRRKFVQTLLLGAAAVPFAGMLYGIFKGKYNYKVFRHVLEFDDLPEAFDGYTITQVSDIHCGSFDNKEKITYGIDLINEQKSDVILFTGDMVNNKADELDNWMDLFTTLKAPDGKFAVLGNHDYGDYYNWETDKDKVANLEDLKQRERTMGFDLLLNEHRYLERNGQRIALVGVENWGSGHFKKAGDLDLAKQGINKDDFKILMSHDPSHWDMKVKDDDYHFHMTLAGHTHGMQFGIEIPGWIKWSPVKWRYKHWAGLYQEQGQWLHVNRGFGYLAFPGRVGIWPEITVIQLKKRNV